MISWGLGGLVEVRVTNPNTHNYQKKKKPTNIIMKSSIVKFVTPRAIVLKRSIMHKKNGRKEIHF